MTRKWLYSVVGGVCVLLVAACGQIVPARTPAQLMHTPGAPVTLTDIRYDAAVFSLRYPVGWQVITGAASQPAWVVFVSPDETALIAVSLQPLDPPPQPPNIEAPLRTEAGTLRLAGRTLYTLLVAPADTWQQHSSVYERLISTIQA